MSEFTSWHQITVLFENIGGGVGFTPTLSNFSAKNRRTCILGQVEFGNNWEKPKEYALVIGCMVHTGRKW